MATIVTLYFAVQIEHICSHTFTISRFVRTNRCTAIEIIELWFTYTRSITVTCLPPCHTLPWCTSNAVQYIFFPFFISIVHYCLPLVPALLLFILPARCPFQDGHGVDANRPHEIVSTNISWSQRESNYPSYRLNDGFEHLQLRHIHI